MILKGGSVAWFWIGCDSDTSDFRVICTKVVFNIISKSRSVSVSNDECDIADNDSTDDKKFCIVNRTGPYTWIGYQDGIVPWVPEPREWQIDAVDAIISTYNMRKNNNNAVVLVTSAPGKGKSTIAMQVAQRLNGKFCKSFNPTDPGDSLSIMIREIRPTRDSPLVVLFDEVDRILVRVHNNMVSMHKDIHTQVKDKCGWNTLLDDVANQTPNVILIMTSNLSRNAITTILGDDSSYLRDGRVHLCIEPK
jgi:adenylate kinase